MEKVFFVNDGSLTSKVIIEKLVLKNENILDYSFPKSDLEFHNWVNEVLFKKNEIKALILPVSLSKDLGTNNQDGLILGLHIRLNYLVSLEKRNFPIICLSNLSFENLLKASGTFSTSNPQNLLLTDGCYHSTLDEEKIREIVSNAESFDSDNFHSVVIAKLNIERKNQMGAHDIGNAWGCFKLSQAINLQQEIFKNQKIKSHLAQLYSKFLICKNESYSEERRVDLTPLKCSLKKILFIDDKADEGWSDIFKKVFAGAEDGFMFIDTLKFKQIDGDEVLFNYYGFINECRKEIGKEWDLILMDLRLNPKAEDQGEEFRDPKKLSGYKLIDEYLSFNEGYQIIVSTASNKIWNINTALDRGAISYYVKESPDSNYTLRQTNEQYDVLKNDIKIAFENQYLFKLFEINKTIKYKLEKKPFTKYFSGLDIIRALKFENLIKDELDSIFYTLKGKNTNKFHFALLSQFKIIESINEIFIEKDETTNKLKFWNGDELKYCKYDGTNQVYELISKNSDVKSYAYNSTGNKIQALLLQKLGVLGSNKLLRTLYRIAKDRNDYIHPERRESLKVISKDKILKNQEAILEIIKLL